MSSNGNSEPCDTDLLEHLISEVREAIISEIGEARQIGSGQQHIRHVSRTLSHCLERREEIPQDLSRLLLEGINLQDKNLAGKSFYGSILDGVRIRSSLNSIRAMDYSEARALLLIGEKNQGARILFPNSYGSYQFGGDETIRAVKFSPCGRYAFTGGDARIVRMWEVCGDAYTGSDTRIDPTTPLKVESLGKLWGDVDGVHHIAKIRDMDTIRLASDGDKCEHWLVASICEGGRLCVWHFKDGGIPGEKVSRPRRVAAYSKDADPDTFNQEDVEDEKKRPASRSSFHALTFLSRDGHIGITGARDEENGGTKTRYGAFWIAKASSAVRGNRGSIESLDEIQKWKGGNNEKSAGWSIECLRLGKTDSIATGRDANNLLVFVGDYGLRLHAFRMSLADETEIKHSTYQLSDLNSTLGEPNLSEDRIFSILSDSTKGHEFLVLLLQRGKVVKINLTGESLPRCTCQPGQDTVILSGEHEGRARCGVLVNFGSNKKIDGVKTHYLYTGGFDHRIIRRKVVPENGGGDSMWERLGSSLGTAAIQFDRGTKESNSETPDLLCTAPSDQPLRWTNRAETSNVWAHGWELSDSPSAFVNSPEKKTEYHALLTEDDFVLLGGADGAKIICKSDDSNYRLIKEKRVWGLATVKIGSQVVAIAACEDGQIRPIQLTDDKPYPSEPLAEVNTPHDVVRAIASPSEGEAIGGLSFVTGGDDRTVRYWSLAHVESKDHFQIGNDRFQLKSWEMPGFNISTWVTALGLSKINSSASAYVAAASDPSEKKNAQVWVWEIDKKRSGSAKPNITPFCNFGTSHTRRITALEFYGTETLFTASEDGYVCAWDIRDYKGEWSPPPVHSEERDQFEQRLSPIRHNHGILDLSLHISRTPEGRDNIIYLASCDRSGEIRVWDVQRMNKWFSHDETEKQNRDDSTSAERETRIEFTESRLKERLMRGSSAASKVHAQVQGASTSYISLMPQRQYEGTRFRKARFQNTVEGLIALKEDFARQADGGPIEVRLDNMIDEIGPLGADFVSGQPQYADGSQDDTAK